MFSHFSTFVYDFQDIAVMTGDTSRCEYYKANSQNVVEKSHCVSNIHQLPADVRSDTGRIDGHFRKYSIPQTQQECEVSLPWSLEVVYMMIFQGHDVETTETACSFVINRKIRRNRKTSLLLRPLGWTAKNKTDFIRPCCYIFGQEFPKLFYNILQFYNSTIT